MKVQSLRMNSVVVPDESMVGIVHPVVVQIGFYGGFYIYVIVRAPVSCSVEDTNGCGCTICVNS